MKSRDFYGGIAFAIFGVIVTALAGGIRLAANLSEPGPRLFPYIAGIGMAVCGAGMALTARKQQTEEPFLTKSGWINLGKVAAALVIYYLALEYIGFLISTPIFTMAIILILASGKKVNKAVAVIISLLTTGILYALFQNVFMIFLPAGKFF